jgi:nucleoside-diphosphate-sugar epimerase
MKVLVIGGTGFVGPHVVKRLYDLGHTVAVFHRGRTEAELPPEVHHIHCPSGTLGDRSYLADFTDAFRQFAPDIVLDMMATTENDAEAVVNLFRGHIERLVVISSQDVYRAYGSLTGIEPASVEPTPLSEDAPLRTRLFPYRSEPLRSPDDERRWMDDYEKILVERTALGDPDLPATILRFPMVYGPHDRQHRIYEYLRRMEDGRPAIILESGLASWRWTHGYVENVAAAVVLAVTNERAAHRIYNVGERSALSMIDWVRAIGRAARWTGEVLAAPRDLLPEALREQMNTDHDLVTDSTRIREELGYEEPVPIEEAIARTVAWERSHPPEGSADQRPDYALEDSIIEKLGSLPEGPQSKE